MLPGLRIFEQSVPEASAGDLGPPEVQVPFVDLPALENTLYPDPKRV